MKICAATGNAGKLRELRRILEAQGHEVVSQKELGITIEPEETGTTFAENALIKAETICKASGLPTIADDSGLCVDALDGATVNNENTGIIQGEFKGSAQGEGSKMTLTNHGTVEDALDGFSLGEGATTTLINEGYANELLANALAGGATTATNDGDVSLRTSGWSKGEGSSSAAWKFRSSAGWTVTPMRTCSRMP